MSNNGKTLLFEHFRVGENITFYFYSDDSYRCTHWTKKTDNYVRVEEGKLFFRTDPLDRWVPWGTNDDVEIMEKLRFSKNFLEQI